MLVYSEPKSVFINDVRSNQIHTRILEEFKRKTWHGVSENEVASWRNSMQFMKNVLEDDEIPYDSYISIEYMIPMSSKRVDLIVSGKNNEDKYAAVVIELKQWSQVEKTDKDGIVKTFVGGTVREVSHPSYQAWSYVQLIRDFNLAVQENDIQMNSCAFLHNLDFEEVIRDDFYLPHLDKAPVYISTEQQKLAEFIKQHVKTGNSQTMYYIENSKLRPSKDLANSLSSMLEGNQEFTMIDEQKVVYETALHLINKAQTETKQVLVVDGGPGTGKSVVAINLLVETIKRNLVTKYVTKNAAPRSVYSKMLAGKLSATRIKHLFSGSGVFLSTPEDTFDALIVDEAHRLNLKSGFYGTEGENQIKELINAAKCTIFFIDEDQRVTFKDIGRKSEIEKLSSQTGAEVSYLKLESQFRCAGSDGYLSWIDDVLEIRTTANEFFEHGAFDFRIYDDPNVMREEIRLLNEKNNRARMVAGYCWNWVSRKNPDQYDISIPNFGFQAQWNLSEDDTWIMSPNSVEQIGCIHTSQGLELDHIAVIIGEDLIVRDGKIVTQPEKRARSDKSLDGYKKWLETDSDGTMKHVDMLIKNTYRTLLTRGSKSCFLYCIDEETQQYFKNRFSNIVGMS